VKQGARWTTFNGGMERRRVRGLLVPAHASRMPTHARHTTPDGGWPGGRLRRLLCSHVEAGLPAWREEKKETRVSFGSNPGFDPVSLGFDPLDSRILDSVDLEFQPELK